MKLQELNDRIAAVCEMREEAVAAVQAETFRSVLAALGQGERVHIPDFGVFVMSDVPAAAGVPEKKVIRFRQRENTDAGERERRRAKAKAAKREHGEPAGSSGNSEEG